MIVKLLTEHHLEFLTLTGDRRGSSKSAYAKLPHCWKSHATAHMELSQRVVRSDYHDDGMDKSTSVVMNGPRCEKTCLRSFRHSETQTSLICYRD